MLSCWLIRAIRPGFFVLEDAAGERISWHRTKSGALRRRLELILVREHCRAVPPARPDNAHHRRAA
jgi:hypothetical protein